MFDSFFGFKTHHMWSTPKAIRLVFSVLVLLLEFYLSVKFHPYSTPSSLSKIPKIGPKKIQRQNPAPTRATRFRSTPAARELIFTG